MYSLDVNFLNDRPDLKPNGRPSTRSVKAVLNTDDKRPMFIGLGILIALPAIAGALYGILMLKMADLEKQQATLDSQLGNLEAEKKSLEAAQSQAKAATEETQALASVFNQIKPWSAMAQDIRDRLPPTVQLLSIKQAEPAAGSGNASTPGTAPVSNQVVIKGFASSFNDVNDFMLTLQRSSFLRSEQTKLLSAQMSTSEESLSALESSFNGNLVLPKLPKQVEFEVSTAINDVPASDLMRELERKGAMGLVTRIEMLQNRGVIQAQPAAAAKPSDPAKPDAAKPDAAKPDAAKPDAAASQDKGAKKP